MLDTQEFGDYLQSVGLRDFVGVPCSYLAPLINYAINSERFIMSNNEGDAVAIASGISLCRSLDSSNSKIVSEKTRQSRSFFSKCGRLGKSQGSYLEGNDCRDFSTLPHLSPQAELPKSAEKLTPHSYGVVLMQNSGLSNALSPLTSLNYTFKIPILGFVSLRGERDSSGKNTDEPQHELLGVITDTLLGTCEMKYAFLDSNMDLAKEQVQKALEWLEKGESFFFIVKNKTFSKVALVSGHSVLGDKSRIASAEAAALTPSKLLASASQSHDLLKKPTAASPCTASLVFSSQSLECQIKSNNSSFSKDSSNTESKPDSKPTQPASTMPTRLEALSVLHTLAKDSKALLLATTGKCGRELYEIEDSPNQLYMVGSMGCVSSLSLGIALKSRQRVIAIDGDSALLMRLGALSTNAYYTRDRDNFCHILLDNESHDSTGGQFNLSPFVDFSSIAKSCGYVNVYIAESLEEFESYVKAFLSAGHSVLSDKSAICKCGNADFPSQSLECQNSSDTESLMDSHNAVSKNLESKTNPSNLDSKKGAWFIYLKIQKGSKENLGRPKITPQEVAQRLSEYMRECGDEF